MQVHSAEALEALEKEKQSLRKKKRFQKLIRVIVRNKMWANEAVSRQDEKEGQDGSFRTGILYFVLFRAEKISYFIS